jgi:hypothetical protein
MLPVVAAVHAPGRTTIWTGRALSAIAALFLALDTVMKVLHLTPAVTATVAIGYPEAVVVPIGVIEAVCLGLYLVPRTTVLGAVLLTGYLGGAVASKVRIGAPLASDTLFPIYVAVLIWMGLWLRDRRARAMLAPTGRLGDPV